MIIDINELRYEVTSSIREKVTTYGDNDSDTKYTDNVIEESLKYIDNNRHELIGVFGGYTLDPFCSEDEKRQSKKEARKNLRILEKKMRDEVYEKVPKVKPSGMLGAVFGIWILQSIVGWIVKKMLDKIFQKELQN
jgi:hypothetical protein